jgi:F-type H+-transporting ATPase subunit b
LFGWLVIAAGAVASAQEGKKGESAEHAEPAHAQDDAHGAAHAGDHHDPTDLSEGNATEHLVDPADLRFDMSIYSAIVFCLLLAILAKFAWGPISHGLEKREQTIEAKIQEAHRAAEQATAQLKEYEARLAIASEEAGKIVGQARKDAEAAKEKIMAETQAAAQRERDRAVADIAAAKNQALQEIAAKSVDTAVALAGNIIRREVKPDDHRELIADALNQFPNLN